MVTELNGPMANTLFNLIKKVIDRYEILPHNTRILIALSGGIDSIVLSHLLHQYNLKFRPNWEIYVVHINPGFEGWRVSPIEKFLKMKGYRYEIIDAPIKPRLETVERNHCFFCSRLRRKILVEYADALSIKTIALAHNKDDIVETLLLNLLFTRGFGTIIPKQSILQGRFFFVRPLYYIDKDLIQNYARLNRLPVIKNRCPYASLNMREEIRRFLKRIKKRERRVVDNIFYGITNIKTQYLP